jgi:hypothetical protein
MHKKMAATTTMAGNVELPGEIKIEFGSVKASVIIIVGGAVTKLISHLVCEGC